MWDHSVKETPKSIDIDLEYWKSIWSDGRDKTMLS